MAVHLPDPDIQQRIHRIRAAIPATVEILAVSKGASAIQIRAAYAAGLRHFGESRIQEAKAKQAELADLPDLVWHLIGHLQTNKIKQALELFDWIESVDSWKLAQQLQQRAWELGRCPQLCLQVKLLPDPQKYGWSVAELLQNLPALDQLSALKIQGLMTILPQGLSETEIESVFSQLPALAERIRSIGYERLNPQVLSMGMSDDYPQAIAAGSTRIRLGRVLFAEPFA